MEFIEFFFDPDRFMQRGHCGLWDERVMALYMISNVAIFVAFTAIPLLMIFMMTDYDTLSRDKPLRVVFAAFILLCGIGHLEGVLSFYIPTYHLYAVWDAMTAVVAWLAVGMLIGRHQAITKARAREKAARHRMKSKPPE